ncbi:flagellin [Butyrivibrio proteoclasticus]|uniref:flagellin N-terminal helical domain-containing protein n=1 Tax=Butyrivibrio proteoclasticus TaxID=43305 RepID=UPI00047D9033|nr:flagellin [Butyrivibrio proteoclasticus]
MVIQHNLAAMNSQRMLGITTGIKAKSSEKLSSGYRINRAADDAAGLAISEKMRRQIRGMGQNMDNIQDGTSFCQVADGYLNEVHDMLQRINELSVKGANAVLTSDDRAYVNDEVQAIKDEIERIFDTATFNEMKIFKLPYTPTVEPFDEPYDTQIFYSSPGVIGGLEFNNVRYNLDELRAKGLDLDANGRSTKEQTVEFSLWDNEKVSLTLQEGDSLVNVKRNYEWKADSNGIKINNVDAATWASLGISGNGNDAGTYSFVFHGMKISFDVEQGDSLETIMDGINGNSITEASYWTVSPSSTTNRSVVTFPSSQSVNVTNANKDVVDDKFEIKATTTGLSITRTDKDTGATSTSSETSWGSFSNVGGAIPRTPTENTNGGYPIVDWGLDVDSNDQSQITFETEATYRFTKTADNVGVDVTFKLADVSSRDDVISAMDGVELKGSVNAPATLTSNSSSLFISGGSRITSGGNEAFELQRQYGRNFDTNANMTGSIGWTKTDTKESAHTLDDSSHNRQSIDFSNSTSADYYYRDDNGDIHFRSGEVIQSQLEHWTRTDNYSWTKDIDLSLKGQLGNSQTEEDTHTVTTQYSETKIYKYDVTNAGVYSVGSDTIITDAATIADLEAQEAAGTLTIENGAHAATRTVSTSTLVSDTTSLIPGSITFSGPYLDQSDTDLDKTAFSYSYSVSFNDLVNNNSGSAGFTLSFNNQPATRTLTPNSRGNGNSVVEHDFMNIVIEPPEKQLIIQATTEGIDEHQIFINWSALNLSVIGMTGANTLTEDSSLGSIELTKSALAKIAFERSRFGSSQNKLEHAYNYTANAQENTQYSESMIRDTDMNSEIWRYRNNEILMQAGQSLLAQANQSKDGVLSLLQ